MVVFFSTLRVRNGLYSVKKFISTVLFSICFYLLHCNISRALIIAKKVGEVLFSFFFHIL